MGLYFKRSFLLVQFVAASGTLVGSLSSPAEAAGPAYAWTGCYVGAQMGAATSSAALDLHQQQRLFLDRQRRPAIGAGRHFLRQPRGRRPAGGLQQGHRGFLGGRHRGLVVHEPDEPSEQQQRFRSVSGSEFQLSRDHYHQYPVGLQHHRPAWRGADGRLAALRQGRLCRRTDRDGRPALTGIRSCDLRFRHHGVAWRLDRGRRRRISAVPECHHRRRIQLLLVRQRHACGADLGPGFRHQRRRIARQSGQSSGQRHGPDADGAREFRLRRRSRHRAAAPMRPMLPI